MSRCEETRFETGPAIHQSLSTPSNQKTELAEILRRRLLTLLIHHPLIELKFLLPMRVVH